MYEELQKELNALRNLQENEIKLFKPMPCPIDKIQNRYRWRIIIKGNMTEEINRILNDSLKNIYKQNIKDTRIAIDVNPNSMSQQGLGDGPKNPCYRIFFHNTFKNLYHFSANITLYSNSKLIK